MNSPAASFPWRACGVALILLAAADAGAQESPALGAGAESSHRTATSAFSGRLLDAEDGPPGVHAISLDQAIAGALQTNLSDALSRSELSRTDALVTEARGAAIPTLAGNVTYTRLDHERAIGTNRIAGRDQLAANFMLSVPVVAPQRWTQLGHAKDNRHAAELDVAATRQRIALDVAHAYLSVVSQHRNIAAQRVALQNARAHYENAHARFIGGIGNALDDVRAAQEVATSEALLADALTTLIRLQESLGVMIGQDGPADSIEPEPIGAAAALPDEPLAARADVKASAQRTRAAENVVNDRWADYAPTLLATFMPFYQNPPTIQFPRTGWQAQAILTIPIFDGTVRRGLAHERESLLSSRRLEMENTLRQASSEVRVAVRAVQLADESLQSAERAGELARQSFEMASSAYSSGATTNIEVIDSERRARDAQTTRVIAEDAARRARLELLAATGRLQ